MDSNRIILPITPQTNIRSTQGDSVCFRIPEDCPVNCGLPRQSKDQPEVVIKTIKKKYPELYKALGGDEWKPRRAKKTLRYGCPHMLSEGGLKRKRQLEKYNQYKNDVLALAKKAGFEMPISGWSLYFFLPMPKRFKNYKSKTNMAGQLHLRRPDIDNYTKGFFDSLSIKDERVAQLSGLGKFWTDKETGYIEIHLNQKIYNPYKVKFIDQDALEQAPKRKYVLTKPKAPRGSKKLFKKEDKIK